MSEATARKVLDAFNRHDSAAFASAYAASAVAHDPMYAEPLRGRDSIQKDIGDLFRAFPDITGTADRVLEKNDVVAFDATMKGTNTGPLTIPGSGEVPATNKPVTFRAAIFCRFNAKGEIEEERRYFDVASMMTQLGLAREPNT